MRAQTIAVAVALAAAALTGCGKEFTPASVIEDLRVLAIVADPPEVLPGESVGLTAVTAAPALAPPAAQDWWFCPLSLGASAGYACVSPLCETHFASGTDQPTLADPLALAVACLTTLGAAAPPDLSGGPPERFEAVIRYAAADGLHPPREAVQRLPIWTGTPPSGWTRNRPPVLEALTIGGADAALCDPAAAVLPASCQVARGAALPIAAAVPASSIDTYRDRAGETLTEAVVVSFFTTAGRFTEQRGQPPLATTALQAIELPPAAAEAYLWIVARDLRGGEAVAGPFRVGLTD